MSDLRVRHNTLSNQYTSSLISNEQQSNFNTDAIEHVEDHPYNDNVHISVSLDENTFIESVSGHINIEVIETSVLVKDITLFIQGRESVENEVSTDNWDQNVKELLSLVVPIAYAFPFLTSIVVMERSAKVLTSIHSPQNSKLIYQARLLKRQVSVSYFATIQLEFHDSKVGNLNYHKEFIITEDHITNVSKPVFAAKTKTLDGLSNLVMKVHTDRDVFFPPPRNSSLHQETRFNKILFLSEILNESYESPVQSITIKLLQYMTIKSKTRIFHLMNEILRKSVDGVDMRVKDTRMNIVPLPANLQPTTNGDLIHVFYRLEITCIVNGVNQIDTTATVPISISLEQDVKVQKRRSYTHKRASSKKYKNYYGEIKDDSEEDDEADPWENETYHVVEPLISKISEPLFPCCNCSII